MSRATLHVLSGKLASGKTTLPKEIAEETRAVLISEAAPGVPNFELQPACRSHTLPPCEALIV